MIYFAYGSNMLVERLQQRVPSARTLGVGSVQGHCLRFHKRSTDGSGKCNLADASPRGPIAYGVLFNVPDAEREALDRAEGLGHGYLEKELSVLHSDGRAVSAMAYVATSAAIDERLRPYDWYHRLVLFGARQHSLPAEYVADILRVATIADPKPMRPAFRQAVAALEAAGVNCNDMKPARQSERPLP